MPTDTEIKKMKRGELNELAATLDINPDDYGRADELRSAIFAQRQQQETQTEEEVVTEEDDATEKQPEKKEAPKPNPARPRVERRSKRYRNAFEQIDKSKDYDLKEAVELIQKTSAVKFDAAVELHINLGVDPKQADQLVRGTIALPHGSGKSQRVAVLAPDSLQSDIKKAGADLAGNDVIDAITKGKLDFDILVAHPDMMKDLSKHAKTLGPKGLMPSPKAGTVTEDVAKTVTELKAGRIEYRVDRYGNIHQIIGRVSFQPQQLLENAQTLYTDIVSAKPSSLKGTYIQRVSLNATMGPALKLDITSLA